LTEVALSLKTEGNLTNLGGYMKSLFLEGLKTARDLAKDGDLSKLDALIKEHEDGTIETAAINPAMESR
jgi:hypothetical protein